MRSSEPDEDIPDPPEDDEEEEEEVDDYEVRRFRRRPFWGNFFFAIWQNTVNRKWNNKNVDMLTKILQKYNELECEITKKCLKLKLL